MALDLPRLLIESVSLLQALATADFEEAQFRARRIGDLAWADNCSAIGNPAINLEIALRAMPGDPLKRYEDDLAFLIVAVESALKPLRDRPHSGLD
jgi:hypothetical protein